VSAHNWFWTRPLAQDGVVYAGSLDSEVFAVDSATGESRWAAAFKTEAPVRAAPVIAGGGLIAVDRDGTVYKIDQESGAALGDALDLEADVLADPLVLVGAEGEVLLLVTTDGELVRIDPDAMRVIDRKRLVAD
jgi:serine/threonine-protein kinase